MKQPPATNVEVAVRVWNRDGRQVWRRFVGALEASAMRGTRVKVTT